MSTKYERGRAQRRARESVREGGTVSVGVDVHVHTGGERGHAQRRTRKCVCEGDRVSVRGCGCGCVHMRGREIERARAAPRHGERV